jgi:hypothetical protein
MQKTLTLLIAGAILYMVFQHSANSILPPKNAPTATNTEQANNAATEEKPLSGNFIEKTLSTVLINVLKTDEGRMFVENLVQPANKSVAESGDGFSMNSDLFLNSIFKISTFGDGEKGPASCGQVVTAHYKILTLNNVVLEEKTATFALGANEIAPGMDAVITGMKTGQTRHATITNKYMQGTENDKPSSFKINVLLKEIMPANFAGDDIKIFDDRLTYRIPLVCGNKAIYDAKITKLSNGEILFDSTKTGKKINMTIGNITYPAIFSHALHNKIPVGSRTVITPGRLLKSYASDTSVIFPEKTFQENEYFMVEFFNFDDAIKTPATTFDNVTKK